MIFLRPRGGLCNRIRTIDSVITLCKNYKKDLTVFWANDADLNCNFEDLFETPKISELKINILPTPLGFPEKYYPKPVNLIKNFLRGRHLNDHQKIILKQVLKLNKNRVLNETYLDDKYNNILLEESLNVNEVDDLFYDTIDKDIIRIFDSQDGSGYINSCYRLCPLENRYSYFVPKEELQNRINKTTSKFQDTIGLHIRRSDHLMAAKVSTIEIFMEILKNEIEANKNATFFLSTDDETTKKQIIDHYGERVIYNEISSYDRNSPEAIKDAVVDLYCLSRTDKLFGSHHSSFSQVAAKIGGIEEITAKLV